MQNKIPVGLYRYRFVCIKGTNMADFTELENKKKKKKILSIEN